MAGQRVNRMVREWIIFALCLGVGGHIALGFVLHAPDLWPWGRAGLYGLFSGVAVYAVVQAVRWMWGSGWLKRSSE